MRYALLALAILAPVLFPWPLSAALALSAAIYFPLAPLACGILIDALYFAPGAYPYPFFLAAGLLAALAALFVHRFVETSIMRG
jgi:hypothetical protein